MGQKDNKLSNSKDHDKKEAVLVHAYHYHWYEFWPVIQACLKTLNDTKTGSTIFKNQVKVKFTA